MDNIMMYYGLTFLAIIITVGAQIFINTMYGKYKKIKNRSELDGAEAARKILDKNGLQKVYIVETKGNLTDHYDPTRKVIKLSSDVFHNSTIASVAIAAHECGHAIQDNENYSMLRIRAMLVPIVNFSTYAGYISIVLGCIFSYTLIWVGILLEAMILVFQLVTLPVEIDASKRALKEIESLGLLTSSELDGGKSVLISAAMTYVASVATALIEVLRLVLIYGNRRDN